MKRKRITLGLWAIAFLAGPALAAEASNAYFGDLHIHKRYSYDAFFFGTKGSPDDACEFAKGKPLTVPSGEAIQLDRPLDFYRAVLAQRARAEVDSGHDSWNVS